MDRRPNAELKGGGYAYQRQLRDSRIVQRAAARGIDLYLGFFAVNRTTPRPRTPTGSTTRAGRGPPRRWASCGGREHVRLPWNRDRSGALRRAGALDLELPGQHAHRGRGPRQGQAARPRGDDGDPGRLPGVEIGVYNFMQRDSWLEWVYETTGSRPYQGAPTTDAFASARGHRFLGRDDVSRGLLGDPPVEQRLLQGLAARERPRGTLRWENALRADVSNTAELLSKEFENWDYAAARYHSSPFPGSTTAPSPRRGTTRDRPATSRHSSPRCASSGWAGSRTITGAAG